MCEAYSLALDECTDISGIAQLVIFIRGVTDCFEFVEESLDMASLSSTTTGHDIYEHEIREVGKLEMNPAKLCGLTTDGAPSLTGRTNGFTQKGLCAVGAQEVVVSH